GRKRRPGRPPTTGLGSTNEGLEKKSTSTPLSIRVRKSSALAAAILPACSDKNPVQAIFICGFPAWKFFCGLRRSTGAPGTTAIFDVILFLLNTCDINPAFCRDACDRNSGFIHRVFSSVPTIPDRPRCVAATVKILKLLPLLKGVHTGPKAIVSVGH